MSCDYTFTLTELRDILEAALFDETALDELMTIMEAEIAYDEPQVGAVIRSTEDPVLIYYHNEISYGSGWLKAGSADPMGWIDILAETNDNWEVIDEGL